MAKALSVSFEFFPPKTPSGQTKLLATANELASLKPDFFSVTFGAGGSTKSLTKETVSSISQTTAVSTAPHISCLGTQLEDLNALLDYYSQIGIKRLVVLRGDRPKHDSPSQFFYANELVTYIKQQYGDTFWIEVACYPDIHPESNSATSDFEHFVNKVRAGADSAITQYFYNLDAYYHFVEKCQKAKLEIDIIPGIMPITQFERLIRFSSSCGADIPQWLRRNLEDFQDSPESLKAFGLEFVSQMCNSLLENGAQGLHFYTLNDAEASMNLCQQLNLDVDKSSRISSRSSAA